MTCLKNYQIIVVRGFSVALNGSLTRSETYLEPCQTSDME